MAEQVAVPTNQLANLYAEKGEIVTQLEIAQNRLQQINVQLAQMLGLNQQAPPVQGPKP